MIILNGRDKKCLENFAGKRSHGKQEERGLQKKKLNMNLRYIESWMDLVQDGVHFWASILAVLKLLFLLSDS